MEDGDKIVNEYRQYALEIMVEQAIKFKFPNIKHLKVDVDNGVITYEGGEYTKEEVEMFINSFKKNGMDK